MNVLFAAFALPEWNATLNAVSFVLLISGFVAIKQGRRSLHITCMLSALIVSTIFLISYLYYHYMVGHVEFGAQYLQRHETEPDHAVAIAYGVILTTHIILAVTVAPLALTTAFLGLRNALTWHRRLAKWTLPIWVYVSVTGVVVYWMVYQMQQIGEIVSSQASIRRVLASPAQCGYVQRKPAEGTLR